MHLFARGPALAVCILASAVFGQTVSEQFHGFLNDAFEEQLKDSPSLAASFGRTEGTGRWMDLSPEGMARRRARWRKFQSDLKRFHRSELNEADRLHYDLFAYQIDRIVEGDRYPEHLLVVDQLFSGPHIHVP